VNHNSKIQKDVVLVKRASNIMRLMIKYFLQVGSFVGIEDLEQVLKYLKSSSC